MNYSPKVYRGPHFENIFTEIFHSNTTVDKNLVRVLDNIKFETQVRSLAGKIAIQDYKVELTSADSSENITFSDATVTPKKKMAYLEFEYESLRSTQFSESMKSGAAQMESDPFLSAVLNHITPQIGLEMEAEFWKGIVADLATGAIDVTGVALTSSNLVAELTKAYEAVPAEVLNSGDVKIFADHKVAKLVMLANLNSTYRDIFVVSGNEHYFLGVKIEYVQLEGAEFIIGRPSDLIWATDLLSDMGSIEVAKVKANSDLYFAKAVFTMDTAVCVPAQKVIYKVVA